MPLSASDVEAIYRHVKGETLASEAGIVSLIHSIEHVVEHDIPGAFLECGVFVGGNIQVMILTLQLLGRHDRDIWAYDTFRGMPKPQEIDQEFNPPEGWVSSALENWTKSRIGNPITGYYEHGSKWVRYGLRGVLKRIRPLGYPKDKLHFVVGMVEDTIPKNVPEQIALARFDTDFYASTKHEFVHLYPRVASGGIIYVDDYGAFLGSQTATDEYIKANDLNVTLVEIDNHIRLIVKP